MKIIKIKSCPDCKYWDLDWCYHPSVQNGDEDARKIENTEPIPDWCPLENYDDKTRDK